MERKGSGQRPYVHSNADYFSEQPVSLAETIVAEVDMRKSIETLRKVSNQLKTAADNFLEGVDPKTVTNELLRTPDTYATLATDIIQSPELINSLVVSLSEGSVSKEKLMALLNKGNNPISESIKTELTSLQKDVPVEQVAKIIGAAFGDKKGTINVEKGTLGKQVNNLFKGDSGIEARIEEKYKDAAFNRLSSAKANHRLVEIIKDLLLNSEMTTKNDNSNIDHSVDKFLFAFSRIFLQRAKKEIKFQYVNFSPTDYMAQLDTLLRNEIKKDIKEKRNASGAINEEILVSVNKADKAVNVLTAIAGTGKMKDKEIVGLYKQLHAMKTFHGEDKESLTDVLIQNQSGQIVRAQAKTSTKEFTYTVNNEKVSGIAAYLQRTIDIFTLLNSLNNITDIPIGDIDDICYTLANALWFNSHDGISGKRETGFFDHQEVHYKNILSDVVKAVGKILATQIPYFLGVSLEQTTEEIKVDALGSNIFYIANGWLVPTYKEVDEVIADLENYITKVEGAKDNFHFVVETDPSWKYNNEEGFWLEKYEGDTYNSTPGFEQGEEAISSIFVHTTLSSIAHYGNVQIGKK